ncbi:MAG: hypothetical protein LBT60_00750 [Oscillospiraceae bacterium]|nr:hypothetical protein [Oscillospiraceae bacterium]
MYAPAAAAVVLVVLLLQKIIDMPLANTVMGFASDMFNTGAGRDLLHASSGGFSLFGLTRLFVAADTNSPFTFFSVLLFGFALFCVVKLGLYALLTGMRKTPHKSGKSAFFWTIMFSVVLWVAVFAANLWADNELNGLSAFTGSFLRLNWMFYAVLLLAFAVRVLALPRMEPATAKAYGPVGKEEANPKGEEETNFTEENEANSTETPGKGCFATPDFLPGWPTGSNPRQPEWAVLFAVAHNVIELDMIEAFLEEYHIPMFVGGGTFVVRPRIYIPQSRLAEAKARWQKV